MKRAFHSALRTVPVRGRTRYAGLIVATVLAGLASRRFGAWLPPWVAAYAGDTLWALLVFWLLGWSWPRWSTGRVMGSALGFAFAIEISQLYHAPWLDALRATTLGSLVLGHGFLWADLLCYCAGVLIGGAYELAQERPVVPTRQTGVGPVG